MPNPTPPPPNEDHIDPAASNNPNGASNPWKPEEGSSGSLSNEGAESTVEYIEGETPGRAAS